MNCPVCRRRSRLDDLPDWYRTTKAISADWVFNVLAARNGQIGFVDEVMAVHRLHSESLTLLHGADRLLARVTARAVEEMGLTPGMACHAILKATTVAPGSIGR